MTVAAIVVFDTTVAYVILLAALLTSTPVMWLGEYRWNFSAFQRRRISNFI
jgi:hypothetical protein